MKTPRVLASLGACLLFVVGMSSGCRSAPLSVPVVSERAVAFVGVHVVPMDTERVLADQTVVVRNGFITALGPSASITVPADAERIEGRGHFLMPGLADFQIHLHSDEQLLSYLAHGVTTVFDLNGSPRQLALRAQLAEQQRFGPRLYASSPLFDGQPGRGDAVAVTSAEQARIAVVRQKLAGYDAIKVYHTLDPEVYAVISGMARQQKLPVVGHVPRRGGVDTVLRARQALVAPGTEFFALTLPEEAALAELARATKAAGTTVVPGLVQIHAQLRMLENVEGVFADPEARYLSPEVLRTWSYTNPTRRIDVAAYGERERALYPLMRAFTRALQKEGARLVVGTDASDVGLFPGASVHRELGELVDAGLSPYAALCAATRDAGAFIQEHVDPAARFGTVAVGQHADLMLLPANPLEDVGRVGQALGVMSRGLWLPREKLQRMRDKAAKALPGR
ncbi:amidohydrolase family protein [Melittangium boletus]|uniref:amidohydrolase family protein n=1 Tax=Melittangium boletus TaxID=83453 RepID=UPI003DA2FAEF